MMRRACGEHRAARHGDMIVNITDKTLEEDFDETFMDNHADNRAGERAGLDAERRTREQPD